MAESQTATPPPSPSSLRYLLQSQVQSLQSQIQAIRQLGLSLIDQGADPESDRIRELQAMYERTSTALDDATKAHEIHSNHTTPAKPQKSIFGSPSPTPQPQSPTPQPSNKKRRTSDSTEHNALPFSTEPTHKRIRPATSSTRKDFANPYETTGAPPNLEPDDITAEVEARLKQAEERRRRRLDSEEKAEIKREVESAAGKKHRRISQEKVLAEGRDGGRYWLDPPRSADEQLPRADRIFPVLRTETSIEPANKRLKSDHGKPPKRKTLLPAAVREKHARNARDGFTFIETGLVMNEVKTQTGYAGPGIRRYDMRRTVEQAQNSKLHEKSRVVLGRIEAIGKTDSGKVGGLEFGKRKENEGGGDAGGGKRRRVQNYA